MNIELLTEYAKTAAEELGVSDLVSRPLHPDVGGDIASRIRDHAFDLQRDAEAKKREEEGQKESAS